MNSVAIQALAVAMPPGIRTNDYYRQRHPELVAEAERAALARLFARGDDGAATNLWDEAMAPYLADPFRGTVERRILDANESALSLEVRAVRAMLAAAKMNAGDIDLAIVTSFLPDQLGPGNAAFLARELGLRCPAWNVEATCTSGLVALQTANALVATGQYANALIVVSCAYSRAIDDRDTLGWFMGDGAGAFLVGPAAAGTGCLGFRIVNTAATCDTFYYDLFDDPERGTRPRIQCTPRTGRILRDTSEAFVRQSAEGAARAAGVELADIDCFVFNTPTAWFAAFAARALGVDPSRTVSTYPRYANVGPALFPVNLYEAAASGRIAKGDLVMVYTIGSVSNAGAAVLRWGDVALATDARAS